MYAPHFQLRCFESISDGAKIGVLIKLLEGLIAANVAYLLEQPRAPLLYESGVRLRAAPLLYQSGVRYVAEPRGKERWQDIPETLERKEGDCEDLACWRIAELRVREGDRAQPKIKKAVFRDVVVYHITLERQDLTPEDPSRVLGMR
jgi:hypothetical protein